MDFKSKSAFKEKMNDLYRQLNGVNNDSKKITAKTIFTKESERSKLLNNLLSAPSKTIKPKQSILTMIEETKRNHLNYKTFLPINIENNSFNQKIIPSSYLKGVNNAPSFNFKSKKKNKINSLFSDEKSSKNENLKKEIMNQLENRFKKDQNNTISNLSTLNKSYKEIESSLSSTKYVF